MYCILPYPDSPKECLVLNVDIKDAPHEGLPNKNGRKNRHRDLIIGRNCILSVSPSRVELLIPRDLGWVLSILEMSSRIIGKSMSHVNHRNWTSDANLDMSRRSFESQKLKRRCF